MVLPKSLKEAKKDKIYLTNDQTCDIIRNYIQEQIGLSKRKQESEENFSLPAWSEFQAFHLGQIKSLEKILEFIPLTKGNEDV